MNTEKLLAFIAGLESGGDFNIVWGGIKKADRPKKPLTAMTIAEVLAWQDSIDKNYRSEAAGAYQILEDTLRGLWKDAGLSLASKFDEAGQKALAQALLRRRGLVSYLEGKITAETFANNLAHEWASLPLVSGKNAGRSVYAGDGLNKSLTKASEFLAVVKAVKDAPASTPDPQAFGLSWLVKFIMQAIGLLTWKRN